MGCISGIIKYLLFLTNFLVFAVGIVVLVFSVIAYVDGGVLGDLFGTLDSDDLVVSVFSTASILLMVVSVIVVLASFFGCCGAIKESKCLLSIYMVILICAFAAIIAGAVLGYGEDSNDVISKGLTETLEKYDPKAVDSTLEQSWDTIQTEYQCCGVDEFIDWNKLNGNFAVGDNIVPKSCCSERGLTDTQVVECQKDPSNVEWVNKLDGCLTKLKAVVEDNQEYILWGCIAILIMMAFNLAAAFITCCAA